ncbi:MAG: ABC transporter permease [Lachnospiraceae bacterium]|nr:ABC transporter permease [Lachnospiraceae bacterium]
MLAIYKKEMRTYFTSIVGYLFLAFFLALIGLYFYAQNLYSGSPNFGYALGGVMMFFILLVPMVTMRIMAEENKQKTDQLLYTSPISVTRIILGKYFSILSMFGIVMLVTCVYPPVMAQYGTINFKQSYACILAFFLMGAAYMAIGLFISALTESQAFAAIMTFVVVIISVFASQIAVLLPTDAKTAWLIFSVLLLGIAGISYVVMHNITVSILIAFLMELALFILYQAKPEALDGAVLNVFGWFSISDRFTDFVYGEFAVSAVVYYVSYCVLFVFLTIQAVKKRRWS